jgi:hypothetical protein
VLPGCDVPHVTTNLRHNSKKAVEERDSLDGSTRPSLAIRDAPGAGLVMWAESAAGALELERPYARSATLDGELLGLILLRLLHCRVLLCWSWSGPTHAAATLDVSIYISVSVFCG